MMTRSGTSMAAASVASAALLVRQYFREGWHIAGVADPSAGFNASGALIKAVLIHAGEDLGGTYPFAGGNVAIGRSPSKAGGFGSPNLARVLPLSGDRIQVWVFDSGKGLREGEVAGFLIHPNAEASSGDEVGDVRITLVWTDYPGRVGAQRTLVNDLDLNVSVVGNDGLQFRTNDPLGGKHPKPRRDDVNSVERVEVRIRSGGDSDLPSQDSKLAVRVSAHVLQSAEAQPFALVVTGPRGTRVEAVDDLALLSRAPRACPSVPMVLVAVAFAVALSRRPAHAA